MALHPPSPVRILFFCLLGVAVGVLGWWYARAVRRFDSDDLRLAQYVDDHTPGLDQRLITSIDSLEKQKKNYELALTIESRGIFTGKFFG